MVIRMSFQTFFCAFFLLFTIPFLFFLFFFLQLLSYKSKRKKSTHLVGVLGRELVGLDGVAHPLHQVKGQEGREEAQGHGGDAQTEDGLVELLYISLNVHHF
jgi:hypothetical protein